MINVFGVGVAGVAHSAGTLHAAHGAASVAARKRHVAAASDASVDRGST